MPTVVRPPPLNLQPEKLPSSCSHWWHAPIYFVAAVAIVITASPSSSSSSDPPSPTSHAIAKSPPPFPAAAALNKSGYGLAAAILQQSPDLFLPPSHPATLFAAPDSALANISHAAAERLLTYHTVPSRITRADLRRMARGTCLSTLLHDATLVVTDNNTLNGVRAVAVPDIFRTRRRHHVVHGAGGAFLQPGGTVPTASSCDPSASARWGKVVLALGARGYVSFAVGLSAVVYTDGSEGLPGHLTIFAPRGRAFDKYAPAPAAVLDHAVRSHVGLGSIGYEELVAMPVGGVIPTMARSLKVTASGGDALVVINGVPVTEPEVYVDAGVVVHGIARSLI